MAIYNFKVNLSFEDNLFGKKYPFSHKQIEVWKKEGAYEELVKKITTNAHGNALFSFNINSESLPSPVIFLKVRDENGALSYFFSHNALASATLTEGDNALTVILDSELSAFGLVEDYLDCTAQITNNSYEPYAGLEVGIKLKNGEATIQDLGQTNSNALGFFGFSIYRNKEVQALLASAYNSLSFFFEFYNEKEEVVGSLTKPFSEIRDLKDSILLTIDLNLEVSIASKAISELSSDLDITYSSAFENFLSVNNIYLLADIRAIGSFKSKSELTSPEYMDDAWAISKLDAHAQLETLSSDFALNATFIDKGYTSVFKIATTPRSNIVREIASLGQVNQVKVEGIHRIATAHQRLYQNVFAEKLVAAYSLKGDDNINDVLQLIEDKCKCDDCEAAVSPFAYLADLLWYAEHHLYKKSSPSPTMDFPDGFVETSELQELFCINFQNLLTDCAELHERICQYRVAIEVLNCFKNGVEPNACQQRDFELAEKHYLKTAYHSLLEANGTSFAEVRAAANSNDQARKRKLAEKMGITLWFDDDDDNITGEVFTTDKLYLTLGASNAWKALSHDNLEKIFGFRNYTRSGTDNSQPIPYIITWKKEFQQERWLAEDNNNDKYSLADSSNAVYIIDPDLLIIDDFRPTDTSSAGMFALSENPAFNVWTSRRKFVDKIWLEKFLNEDSWSESGIEPSYSEFEIAADFESSLAPGTKVRITLSPGNNGIYTVVSAVYDGTTNTKVRIAEKLSALSSTAEVSFPLIIPVTDFSGTTIQLANSFTGNTNDTIEVRGTYGNSWGSNDGIYKVDSVAGITITVDRVLNSGSTGEIVYHQSHAIILNSLVVVDNVVKVAFDKAYVSPTKPIEISSNLLNNGVYNVSGVDGTADDTKFSLPIELKSLDEEGSVTFSSIDFAVANSGGAFVSVQPRLGNRTFTFEIPNLSGIVASSNTVKLIRPGANSSIENLTVNTVTDSGAYSTIKVDEPLLGNEVSGKLVISEQANVTVTNGNTVVVNGAYESYFDLSNPDRSSILIDGVEYKLTSVDDDSTDTTFVTVNSIGASEVTVGIFFRIKEVDTSEKGFDVTYDNSFTAIPSGTFSAGDKISVNVVGSAPKQYTISNITYNGSAPELEIEVDEPVLDDTAIDDAVISFKKSLPIIKRYPYLEDIFQGYASNTISYYKPIEDTTVTVTPWAFGSINVGNIVSKKNALLAGDTSIEQQVYDDLRLDKTAFIRLANIYEAFKKERVNATAQVLTQDDYQELFNILTLAVKKRIAPDWYSEEVTNDLRLNYEFFWQPLVEPKEGNIVITADDEVPYLDPEVVGYGSLPDYTAGKPAIDVFNERKAQLESVVTVIEQAYYNYGFDQMLKVGLGGIGATDDLAANLSQLLDSINRISPTQVQAAEKEIQSKLLISVDDFRFIMQIRAKNTAGTPILDQEFSKLTAILVTAYKKRTLWGSWFAEEEDDYLVADSNYVDSGSYPFWFYEHWYLSKGRLPKWRASLSDRREWQQALKSRNAIPVVDPDLVFAEDFTRYTNNTAYTLWRNRTTAINSLYNSFNSSLLDTAIQNALGVTSSTEVLDDLPLMEEAGISIDKRLAQLNLDYPSYKRLLNLADIYTANTILPEERRELVNILVQAYEWRKLYAVWNDEESGFPNPSTQTSLSPSLFKITPPIYGENNTDFYSRLLTWRATWKDRTQWERKLKSRISQLETLDTALENGIKEVEENILPIMRDALVNLCGDEERTLEQNAETLSNRLLVDFKINCCQYTTRLSHAIDVVQQLIWTESLGIDNDIVLNETTILTFELRGADNFEEEWKWLGSYATWRAAMFVFMYPENLLLPTLRYKQSPAFVKLANDIRGNNRLTPVAACMAAKEYSDFLADITNLDISATVSTKVRIRKQDCVNNSSFGDKSTMYIYAISKKSNRAYWLESTDTQLNQGEYQSWQPIEGLGKNVRKLLGSCVYQQEEGIRHIYLFAIIHEDLTEKLVYVRYDLEKLYWDTEYTELALPEDVDLESLMVLQSHDERVRPEVLFRGVEYKAIYINWLNRKGKDWEIDEWQMVAPAKKSSHLKIHEYVLLKPNNNSTFNQDNKDSYDRIIIASHGGYVSYRLVGHNDDLKWHSLNFRKNERGTYKGHITNPSAIAGTNELFILMEQNGSLKWYIFAPGQLTQGSGRKVKTFFDLDRLLVDLTGHGLSNFTLNDSHKKLLRRMLAYSNNTILANILYSPVPYLSQSNNFLNSSSNPTSIAHIFEVFQTRWVGGQKFIVNDYNGDLDHIDYGDTRPEMNNINSWLNKTYIKEDKSEQARDLKWFSENLNKVSGKVWKNYRQDNTSNPISSYDLNLESLINSLLNFTIFGQTVNGNKDTFKGKSNSNHWNSVITFVNRTDIIQGPYNLNGRFDYFRHNSGNEIFSLRAVKNPNGLVGNFTVSFAAFFTADVTARKRVSPVLSAYAEITEEATGAQLALKKTAIASNYSNNTNIYDISWNSEYFREAYYHVPMLLGIHLSQRGHYKEALKWFRTVYDFSHNDESERKIYEGLKLDAGSANPDYNRVMANWLLDPLNPHQIASGRANSYFKYTLYTIAQTFISYANAEFTKDTVETVGLARELYEFAIGLLDNEVLKQLPPVCDMEVRTVYKDTRCLLLETLDEATYNPYAVAIDDIFVAVSGVSHSSNAAVTHANEVKGILTTGLGDVDFDLASNIQAADDYIKNIEAHPSADMGSILATREQKYERINEAVMSLAVVEKASQTIKDKQGDEYTNAIYKLTFKDKEKQQGPYLDLPWLAEEKQRYNVRIERERELFKAGKVNLAYPNPRDTEVLIGIYTPQEALDELNSYPFPYVPIMGIEFCVPENPVFKTLSLSAELNLFKIRNCLNIAGMKRELDAFAAPTDTVTGLPQIGANGQIVLPGTVNIRPTIYRYEYLLERAKQMVGIAQQVEAAFLSALEKRDAEYYNLLKAKQDLSLSKATVKLKDLQVKVAEGEVDLAALQRERAQIQVQELDKLISAGFNDFELKMMDLYWQVANIQSIIAIGDALASIGTASGSNGFSELANKGMVAAGVAIRGAGQIAQAFMQAGINANSMWAAQRRREDDWNYQKTLATQDIRIGDQQVKIAKDRVRVADQDRNISELQVQNAEATIDFLNNKFTNVDLYDWMSGVLENIYSYFLQTSTGVAKLAQNQLAFERQELPTGMIQDDYWESPTDNYAIQTPGANAPDRRGLTGSARLLQDLYKLDQYAIETEKRKLNISRTFSLASMAPMEFQQFKETGEIAFDTMMEYFDRDFPGHYLRLIKKVKTTVIALIPPTAGIKATLTSSGISHVVIGGTVFQDVIVRRDPEMVALSGASEATGVFEMQMQDQRLLNPFEGSGVHTRWQFKMPKDSNMFDYSSIADVLLTIEYTALHSYDYEQQVMRRLGTDFVADRAFSFRTEFADAFYALTHPDEFEPTQKMKVDLDIRRFDFPANITDLSMEQLKFYFLVDRTDPTEEIFADDPFDLSITTIATDDPTPITGIGATNSKGIISTLLGGGSLTSLLGRTPEGKWTLDFTDAEDHFVDGKILDVIMVITYAGTLPRRQ